MAISKKLKLIGAFIVLGLSLSACIGKGLSAAEKELAAKCDALTQADKEGRVYEMITGEYIPDESHEIVAKPANGPVLYSNVITLAGDDKKTKLYKVTTLSSENMSESDFKKNYKPTLDSVLYAAMKNEHFEDYTFGLCGNKNAEGQYMDKIDTLTFLNSQP